jgi:hypothetical protein
MKVCASCDYPFERKHGYAHLSFGKGESELEQLESWSGQFEVCHNCANVLLAWMNMKQFPAQPQDIHPEPFSCYDERLQYSRD